MRPARLTISARRAASGSRAEFDGPRCLLPVPVLDRDHAIPFVEGLRRIQKRVDDTGSAGADRDGDRHPQAADERQLRVLDQDSCAKLEIQPRVVDLSKRSHVALMLLRPLHAAKHPPRRRARLVRAHALRQELVFEQLRMRIDLACEISLGTGRAEGGDHPQDRPSDCGHAEDAALFTWHSSEGVAFVYFDVKCSAGLLARRPRAAGTWLTLTKRIGRLDPHVLVT
jgi:hypothetical protein